MFGAFYLSHINQSFIYSLLPFLADIVVFPLFYIVYCFGNVNAFFHSQTALVLRQRQTDVLGDEEVTVEQRALTGRKQQGSAQERVLKECVSVCVF